MSKAYLRCKAICLCESLLKVYNLLSLAFTEDSLSAEVLKQLGLRSHRSGKWQAQFGGFAKRPFNQ